MSSESDVGTVEESAGAVIDDETLDRLVDRVETEGLKSLGPDGVLTELTSRIMNRCLGSRDDGASGL
jgi:hypothetical protein